MESKVSLQRPPKSCNNHLSWCHGKIHVYMHQWYQEMEVENLGQIMLFSKCWKRRTSVPSNNEKTQRFVMMSWTRVHLGVWPKSALLTPPHNIMRINQLQLPRDLRKICLAIIGQHLASTIYKSRSLDFLWFWRNSSWFYCSKAEKNNALSACD